jgi:plastocyanin
MSRVRTFPLALAGLGFLVVLSLGAQGQQSQPAPPVDRVGFPAGYQTNFAPLFTLDRPDVRQIRVIYGNAAAAAVRDGQPFPNDSVLVMETYRARADAQSNVVRDANGRFIRDGLTGIFVMRKYRGFGVEYEHNRTGEWEYVAYRPDGTHVTAPRDSWTCANCHLMATEGRDWVFRRNMFTERSQATGAVPDVVLQQYAFVPAAIRVRAGSFVTWVNDDEIDHRIAVTTGQIAEGPTLMYGNSFRARFNAPGEYDVTCRIHPGMRARVTVDP